MRGPEECCTDDGDLPYLPTVICDDLDADRRVGCETPDSPAVGRRKELNRVAAQKCRRRKKERAQTAEMLARDLQVRNAELRSDVERLAEMKRRMLDLIKTHCGASGAAAAAVLVDD